MSMGAVPSICKEPNVRFSEDQQEHWVEVLSRERLDHWKVLVTHENMATWRARVECKYPVADEYAVLLHEWNSALSFAMLASLQIFEVSLRNHIHKSLADHYGSAWWWGAQQGSKWMPSARVTGNQTTDVQKAIDVSGRRSKGVTPGGVVSELSFGFWLALLSPAYDNPSGGIAHWRNCLHSVFEKSGAKITRKEAYLQLSEIVKLRNKCAHHEPIIQLNVGAEFAKIVSFTRKFSGATAVWISETSLVPHLLRPDWLRSLAVAGRLIGLP